MYFDTHAHYDDVKFDPDRDALIASLPENGVGLFLNAGTDLPTSRFGVELTERYPFAWAAVGVHPHEADTLDVRVITEIAELTQKRKVAAIGEIGLDYHYDFSPREKQRHAFRMQMELAQELKMPVIVHDREAHEDCMSIVREFPGVKGVFHCFSGSTEMGLELISLGWYLSFTGAVTFKNARRAPELIARLPADRFMLETDCPYLAPEPHRGERSDSRFLPLIAARIAEIRGVPVSEIERVTTENGRRFFSIAWSMIS